MDILERIRKLQKERNWNDAQLAKAADITKSTISSLHRRNYVPTIPTLQAICDAFGITIGQFFTGDNLPVDLTSKQAELLEHWNTLTDEQKEVILHLVKVI